MMNNDVSEHISIVFPQVAEAASCMQEGIIKNNRRLFPLPALLSKKLEIVFLILHIDRRPTTDEVVSCFLKATYQELSANIVQLQHYLTNFICVHRNFPKSKWLA